MEHDKIFRDELLISGLGGMGVLLIGSLLASAAFEQYKYVSWLPSYGVQPRGGLSECTVIFSEERISSPLLDQAQTIILLDGSQYSVMEPRIRPEGLMIVDNFGMQEEKMRDDIQLLKLPATEKMISIFSEATASNLFLLGAYIATTRTLSADLIMSKMNERFGSKKKMMSRNKKAFEEGFNSGQNYNK